MRSLPRIATIVCCIGALCLGSGSVRSEEVAEGFSVRSASTQLDDGVYFLNAVIEASLPENIRSAIDQGFELPMSMEIEFYQTRNLWFDERVVYIKQQYRLRYHALLDVVTVFDVNAGMGRYFPSLEEALQQLFVVYGFPVLDENNLEPGESYTGRLRFGIDTESLPLPLKSSALWRGNWSLASEWFEWELRS